jgi:type II secretory pathway pseudopilin PulG
MSREKGLTLVETLIVVGLLSILFLLGTIAFSSLSRRNRLEVAAQKISSCLEEAKAKALAGYSQGQASSLNFGVYFESDSYTIFSGLVFDALDPLNQEFALTPGLAISEIGFASNSLIFEKITGQVRNFDPSQNYLVVSDQKTSQQEKITINKLGIVTVE